MQLIFTSLYDFFSKRKPVFWLIFLCSFLLWGGIASQIDLDEDVTSMLPDSKAIKTMNDVVGKTQAGEQVIFLMSFTDSSYQDNDSLILAANNFTHILKDKYGNYIDTLVLQPASNYEEALTEIINQNLPLFLTAKDYNKIDTLIQAASIHSTLESNKKLLMSPASVFYKRLIAGDPIGMSGIVWQKLRAIQVDTSYENYEGYLFYKHSNKLTFFLTPAHKASATGENSKFFASLNKDIEAWQTEHPNISIKYFGGPAVAAGNATQMRTDTIVTLSVTVVLLILLTLYFFRKKRTPLFLLIPVLYGLAMGLGVVVLVQGSISVIALGAGAIIMGIAIDFSIHFLSHVRHSGDIRATIKELSQPLTIGSLTTIAAFLSLRFVSTPILQDLGLFAAASLAGAALCTLIFLPHLPIGTSGNSVKVTIIDKLAQLRPEKNKWLVLGIFLLTPVMFYFSSGVTFDSNMMHLNYLSPELEDAQEEIASVNAQALSSMFVIASDSEGRSGALHKLEATSEQIQELIDKGWVRSISDPTSLLPSLQEQQERIARWNSYWSEERQGQVLANVATQAKELGFSSKVTDLFSNTLNNEYTTLDSSSTQVLLSLFPSSFANTDNGYHAIASLRVPAEHRQQVLDYFDNSNEVTVTDKQEGAAQLAQVLNSDFTTIALYSSLIVFIALLIAYGRFELAIIAFLPMAISWIWILGIMSLLGLQFNIVNIIISSLIFGLGDDYTIFTMDGLTERLRTGKQKLSNVRVAVYVSVLTTIIGLGVLLLAKHPALRSIAAVSVTGLLCVLFISQTLQPFLFNWFIQNRANKKFLPFTLWSFAKSVFAFTYFFLGSMFLTVLGIILTRLWPFNREKAKYMFHAAISRMTWSMMYIMGNVKKSIHNLSNEDFNKPAVYIANHSSFLDILVTTMLHPKLVLLTNKWVWRSPVFGAVVRMGEYYPVADGAEDSIEPLKDLTDRGYSVVVFPEGTRSYDDKIKRFHKGAFYIAEQLRLDVVPLLLHGIHYTMQKGDFLLKDGHCSVYIHKRVSPDDNTYGENYSQRAKYMGKWMRQELAEVKRQNETPSYFREQLLRSYTYKGPVLEWYCRIKTSLEKNYEDFHDLLPREGFFYDLGCGYGFMTYMLHWASPDRHFVGIDYDTEKIETAQGNFLKREHINFEQGDVTQLTLKPCDGIIISDVLHYLLPEQQEALLENCVAALNDGGRLIIRDGVSEMKDRIKGTKLTELFSTKILRFNKTQNDLHFLSRSFIESFAKKHQLVLEVHDNAKMTANLTFVLKK